MLGPVVLSLVVFSGCSRKHASPPLAAPVVAVATDDAARRDSIERANADRDALAREARLREERERRLADARAALSAPLYFAYDRSELSTIARAALDAKAPVLNGSPAVRLRLSGHTDDRGSDEYNLALGLRRAISAKRHLVALGVAEGRLDVVTFGEEEPVCREADESCWSRNRRVEFDLVAGADLIVVR
jgi:peptidoglycan-associated lipoprotein